jgi:hypothetical protein
MGISIVFFVAKLSLSFFNQAAVELKSDEKIENKMSGPFHMAIVSKNSSIDLEVLD